MEEILKKTLLVLRNLRVDLEVEKISQAQAHKALNKADLTYTREFYLDDQNIPDLFLDGIAIEIKIKGAKMAIYKQCVRYCEFPQVKTLILCSSRPLGLPPELSGKPCYFINLSKAYL